MSTTLTSRFERLWRVCTLLSVMLGSSLANASQKRILFYEPDANYHAIVQITQWFNLYLHRQSSAISFSQFKMRMISRRSFATITWPSSSSPPPTSPRLKPSSHLCWYPPTTRTYYRKGWWLNGTTAEGLTGKNIAAALGGTDRNAAISALKAQGRRQPRESRYGCTCRQRYRCALRPYLRTCPGSSGDPKQS